MDVKGIFVWLFRMLLYFIVIPAVVGLLIGAAIEIVRSAFDRDQLILAGIVFLALLTSVVIFLEIRKRNAPKKRNPSFKIKTNRLIHMDWRGEENEGEIQEFIEGLYNGEIRWTITDKLRSEDTDERRDGKFAVRLLKAIDKDLQSYDMRLLFQNTDGDEYVFTAVESNT